MTKIDRRTFAVGCATTVLMARSATAGLTGSLRKEDLIVRPFASKDTEAIATLVAANYGTAENKRHGLFDVVSSLHLRSSAPTKAGHETMVAEIADKVIAVGSCSAASSLHPIARIHVIVSEDHRRQGIGTRLYGLLHDAVRDRELLPLAMIKGTEDIAYSFSKSCGMRVLMRGRHYTIDPGSWPVDLWCSNALARRTPYRFVPGDQVEGSVLWEALWGAYYELHRSFVPTHRRPLELKKVWEPMLDRSQVIVALEGQAPAGAAALISAGKVIPLILFPYAACKPMASIERERALVAQLIADRLVAARKAGHTELMIESEDLDGRLLPVMASIPVRSIYEGYTLTAGADSYWPRAEA